MKPHQERLKEILTKIGQLGFPVPVNLFGLNVAGELKNLKEKIEQGKSLIESYNPENSILISCRDAKALGIVPSCFRSIINFFGITLPMPDSPDSNIDYFICQR